MKLREFLRRIDYRHYLCIAITAGFVLLGVFVFGSAFTRLIEAGRDFGLSVAYYFCEIFGIPYSFTPTVNEFPKDPPSVFLPGSWEAFKASWKSYWILWADADNFRGYLACFGDVAKIFVIALIPAVGVIFLLRMCVGNYLKK